MNLNDIYELLKTKKISDMIDYSHPIKTKNQKIKLSIGRVWFNLITPEDYKLIDEPVNKSKIQSIIKDIYNNYDPEVTAKFVTDINREAFKLGTIYPATFDINTLIIPDFILKKKQELLNNPDIPPDDFNKLRYDLAVEYLEYIKDKYDSGIYDILMSGAKGDPSDWALLMIAKGAMTDIEGNVSKPSAHSLDEGLTLEEFYLSAGEARYTQYQKSKGSAEPGYLASRTAFANSNILLSGDDCGSENYLRLKITPSMGKMITGRYYKSGSSLKEITDGSSLVGKTIELRSPLYCKQEDGICKTCYGTLANRLQTNKIGLLSSATINDQGITTAMKARHKTSQVAFRKANFKKDIIR